MNIAFSLIALAAGIAASLFADRRRDEPRGALAASIFSTPRLLTILLVPALGALLSLWLKQKADGLMDVSMGLLIGAVVAIVAETVDRGPESVAPLGFAVAATAMVHVLAKDTLLHVQLGLATGLGISAWMLSAGGQGRGASRAALLGIAAIAGDYLGSKAEAFDAAGMSGTAFGLVVVIAGLLANSILPKDSQQVLRGSLVAVLLGGGAVAVGKGMGHVGDAWLIFLVAIATGIVVHLLVDPNADSFKVLLASLIWLGAATASFGTGKGFGMAIALVGAAAIPLLLGNQRAILTLGPLAALVLYRVFRELYAADTKAIDIAEHYALIGFGAGVVLPLLPVEWGNRGRALAWSGAFAGLLWVALAVSAPFIAAVMLGAKGVIGFMFGLGFASVVAALKGSERIESLPFALSLGAAALACYGWLDPVMELARKEKQTYFLYIAVVIAIVAALIFLLSRNRTSVEPATV